MSDDVLELLTTAPEPPMSIDPYAAMATGRRARFRRRGVVTVAATAAALAIATGSVVLGGRDGALPARPSPTTSTPSTAARSLTAQIELPAGQVTANLDPDSTTITLRGSRDSLSNPSLALPVPSSAGAASCRVSPALLVLACAVRAPVNGGIIAYNDPTTPDGAPGFPIVGRFSVTDVSVVVVAASAADLPSMLGAAWELDDGTVADSSGAPVPQAHSRTVPVTVFAAPLGGSYFLGLRLDSGGGWGASGPADFGGGAPYTGMSTEAGNYYAYVLPAAAVSGELQPPTSATVRSQEVLVLGGRKVLVAQLTRVQRYETPTVDWVDKAGVVHPLP